MFSNMFRYFKPLTLSKHTSTRFFNSSTPNFMKYLRAEPPIDLLLSKEAPTQETLHNIPISATSGFIRSPGQLHFVIKDMHENSLPLIDRIYVDKYDLKLFDEKWKPTHQARTLSEKEAKDILLSTGYNPPCFGLSYVKEAHEYDWHLENEYKLRRLPELMLMDCPPQKESLDQLPFHGERGLIRHPEGLDLVNKIYRTITRIKLDAASLRLFDEELIPEDKRQLTKKEMNEVISITNLHDYADYPESSDLPADIIWMSEPPNKNILNQLPLKSNAAFVCSPGRVDFVNIQQKSLELIKLNETEFKLFNEKLKPTYVARTLSVAETEIAESITRLTFLIKRFSTEESIAWLESIQKFQEEHAEEQAWFCPKS